MTTISFSCPELRLKTMSMLWYFTLTRPSPSANPLPGPNLDQDSHSSNPSRDLSNVLPQLSSLSPSTELLNVVSQSETEQFPLEEGNFINKKRKWNEHRKFAPKIKDVTGLDLAPAPDKNNRSASYCMSCIESGKMHINNVTERWMRHAKLCTGLLACQKQKLAPPISAQAQNFVMHVIAGGNTHPNPNPSPNPNSN